MTSGRCEALLLFRTTFGNAELKGMDPIVLVPLVAVLALQLAMLVRPPVSASRFRAPCAALLSAALLSFACSALLLRSHDSARGAAEPSPITYSSVNNTRPKVCVLARTYCGHMVAQRHAFIYSLLGQRRCRPSVFLVDTSPGNLTTAMSAQLRHELDVLRLPESHVAVLDVPVDTEDEKDYGYRKTESARKLLTAEDSPYGCEYLLVTNADNLYTDKWMRYLFAHLRRGVPGVASDWLDHNFDFKRLSVSWCNSGCDLGAAVVRVDFARQAAFRLCKHGWYDADGCWFDDIAKLPGFKPTLVHTPLFVHQ
eukprot:TRINITY_DN12429_c0_g1_i2.p1 TRINITY_DN12429_c0_g1~~TRINITY_DN12429_c0_g1_i2.p1  ORF type:complete len:343 (-),score=77.90 TRINITY_DN12429_c0_g1_i2:40-972(-)